MMGLPRFLRIRRTKVPGHLKKRLEYQRVRDLAARQKPGIIFYPVIFTIIAISILITDGDKEKLIWLLISGFVIALATGYRYLSNRRFEDAVKSGKLKSYFRLYFSLGLITSSWGCLLGLTLLPTPFSEHYTLFVSGTLGLCAGGAITLSIQKPMVWIFILGMFTPSVAISFSGYSLQHPGLGGVLIIFGIGTAWVASIPRYEYEQAVLSNLRIREYADNLTKLSKLDWLTGIKNRRYFHQILTTEISRANRIGYPLTLIMVDIDHFKEINDTYGHLFGDRCLIEVANHISQFFHRSSDVVARYGGDEFCILISGAEKETSVNVTERLLRRIAEDTVWNIQIPVKLTVSIGGITVTGELTEPEELIQKADQALYQAKNKGRNCISWYNGVK